MPRMLIASLGRALRLWASAFVSPWRERRSFAVTLGLIVAWPLFCLLQAVHWLGFAVDELLFRGWRRVEVREPVFVLGPPRSGTTHLHHVLACDEQTTTFRLWECLFGLSVTARYLLLGMRRLDRLLGRPVARIGAAVGRRLTSAMNEVHPLSMNAPEEDFLALMPAMQCFILVVVFPRAEWLWRTARLDACAEPGERDRLMAFYRACVKKHMFVFGRGRRFLSKNASFSGMAESLLETFPDARIIATTRDPAAVVPSQLSSLAPGLAAAGFDRIPVGLRDRLIDLLVFYYLHLDRLAAARPGRVAMIENRALHDRLADSVTATWQSLELEMTPQIARALAEADARSRTFRSGHRYSLEQFGLDQAVIRSRFTAVYSRYRFDPTPTATGACGNG